MSEPDDGPEALSPDEEAEYAALLAEHLAPGGADEALPDEVAHRLDARLEELVSQRQAQVLPMRSAARRRVRAALLAAAAVTVGGLTIPAVLDGSLGGGEDAGDAASSVEDAGGGSADADAGAPEAADAEALASLTEALPRIRRDHVAEDVVRVLETGRAAELAMDRDAPAPTADEADGVTSTEDGRRASKAGCVVPDLDEGQTWQLVRYRGGPVVLVVDPEDGPAPRTATLLPCGGGPALVEVEVDVAE